MIENGLYDRLSNYAGLTALVGARVYASHLPQNTTFPCSAYRKINSTPRSLLATDSTVYDSEFDIGCFAKTYDAANDVAEQVVGALQRYSGTNNGVVVMDCMIKDVSNDYETDLEIYEVTVSITITHRGL